MLQTLPRRNLLDLKYTIKGTPHAISRPGGRETRNTPYTSTNCKDRRGYAIGAGLGCPFDFIDTISFSNLMKRE
jgi:hypothetical protein